MNDLDNKFLNLCLLEEIENCKDNLDLLYLNIKFYKHQLDFLDTKKPFWFQKNKLKKYELEKKELENRLDICRENIKEELTIIQKMIEK